MENYLDGSFSHRINSFKAISVVKVLLYSDNAINATFERKDTSNLYI